MLNHVAARFIGTVVCLLMMCALFSFGQTSWIQDKLNLCRVNSPSGTRKSKLWKVSRIFNAVRPAHQFPAAKSEHFMS